MRRVIKSLHERLRFEGGTSAAVSRAQYLAAWTILFILASIHPALSEGPMRLPELESFALSNNPRLKAMRYEAAMAHKRIGPAAALDDPRVRLGANSLPAADPNFRDSDMTSKEIGVSQMVPLGGKLSARENIAEIEYRQARERLRGERLALIEALRSSAYELAYVRGSILILNDIRAQIRLIIDGEVAASKSGTGSLTGVIKANLEYSMMDEELIALAQRETELRERIRYLAGGDVEAATEGLLSPTFVRPPGDGLEAEILESNPELTIMRLGHGRAAGVESLRRSELVPDVEFGLSYMQRDSGPMGRRDDMVSAMASFNLPLFYSSKNSPMIDEAKLGRDSAASLYDDRRNDILARARTLVDSLVRREALYRLYTDRIIPQSSLALEAALARYRTGSVEFMPVIDTLRMLLRYRREALGALKEYHTAIASIEALSGKEAVR
ncbi:MAG: Outer membrane efflux protein [Spirochaetes bacterium ADurb.BinA120]|nr:MAG: Outer membrane efflux protein [Spirochaetes bacterium ADurb.BinA120]